MSLKDWSIPTSTVELPGGGSLAVRGIDVEQVAALVRDDRDTLTTVFDRLTDRPDVAAAAEAMASGEEAPELDADIDMADVAEHLLTAAPRLVAKLIAWAADEPDAVDNAARLPFPVQLDLLAEIGRLTFETTSPGKFMETVIMLARSANTGLAMTNAVGSRSTSGSGG